MATDLRYRLHDLADHTSSGTPPADLWTRGVRRRRAGRAGRIAVAAALVVLVALGGWTWHSARPVQLAAPHGTAHLPDRFFYDVSPWTRTFDDAPGPLVTVFPTVHETLRHTENGIIGVTASSGAYGFLDLPGDAVQSGDVSDLMSLAPDGRRLAFWISGRPSGTANTEVNDGATITGVAVYDTVTGEVRESRIETVHGLDPSLLLWTDDQTLAVGYGQALTGDGSQSSTASRSDGIAIWNMDAPHPIVLPDNTLPSFADNGSTRATRGAMITTTTNRRTWITYDPRQPGSARTFRTDRSSDLLVLSPDHRRAIGVIGGHNADSGPLAVTRIPHGRALHAEARFHRLPLGHRWFRPLAWVDDDHVAVLRRTVVQDPDHGPSVVGRIELVDLRSGTSRTLVEEFGANGSNQSDPWVATDLYAAPSVHAVRPPSPSNLRHWGVGLGIGLVLALLLGATVVQARRAPRA